MKQRNLIYQVLSRHAKPFVVQCQFSCPERGTLMGDNQTATIFHHMNRIFLGQDNVVKCILCALLSKGHILLEGVPGVGKTLIGMAVSRLMDLRFKRIQFTNDLLPLGYHRLPYHPERLGRIRSGKRSHLCEHCSRRRDQQDLSENPVSPSRSHGRT